MKEDLVAAASGSSLVINEEMDETCDANEEEIYCHCCGVKTPKARLHYGGITCYPCRSFFRRATVSKKKKKCKKEGRCQVKLDDRKSCNPCRYNECLRNGMRPHLVLSEDQIHERFKNLSKQKKKEKVLSPSKKAPASERPSSQALLTTIHDSRPFHLFPSRAHDSNTDDTSRNQSDSGSSQSARCKAEPEQWARSQNRPSVLNMNKKFRINDEKNYLLLIRPEEAAFHRAAQIGQQRSVIMLPKRKDEYLENAIKEEDDICIRTTEETDKEESKDDLKMFIQDRSFVEFSLDNEGNEDNEVDKMLLKTLNSIDIKEIENMYTMEEQSYIQFMGQKFRDKWCEVNIGPEVMRDYIAWCKKQGPLSQEMFAVVSRATSERFTRMVETTDEFQDLNIHDKFCLLKSNLKYADTVTMIRKLSFLNPKDDYFDSWGAEDRVMWTESGMDLHAQSMSNILKEMPFDLKLKQQFISLLSQCKLPILADQHVFSLLVAIVIFSSADIQLIERDTIDNIREGYLTMLRRYVWQEREDAEDIINRVMMVISVIPTLAQLFRRMNIIKNV